jgi:hypothetical protein
MRGENTATDKACVMDSIVMGDFNFSDDKEESKLIPDDFVDAWLALRPGARQFTTIRMLVWPVSLTRFL